MRVDATSSSRVRGAGALLCNRLNKIASDRCWRCGRDERQTSRHLFVRCEAWAPQARTLWRSVGKACGWEHSRAPRVGTLLGDERATSAVLTSFRDTKVGEFISLGVLGGGRGVETDPVGLEGEEGSPLPPVRMLFSFFPRLFLGALFLLFPSFSSESPRHRKLGSPTVMGFCTARGLRGGSPVGDGTWPYINPRKISCCHDPGGSVCGRVNIPITHTPARVACSRVHIHLYRGGEPEGVARFRSGQDRAITTVGKDEVFCVRQYCCSLFACL